MGPCLEVCISSLPEEPPQGLPGCWGEEKGSGPPKIIPKLPEIAPKITPRSPQKFPCSSKSVPNPPKAALSLPKMALRPQKLLQIPSKQPQDPQIPPNPHLCLLTGTGFRLYLSDEAEFSFFTGASDGVSSSSPEGKKGQKSPKQPQKSPEHL